MGKGIAVFPAFKSGGVRGVRTSVGGVESFFFEVTGVKRGINKKEYTFNMNTFYNNKKQSPCCCFTTRRLLNI